MLFAVERRATIRLKDGGTLYREDVHVKRNARTSETALMAAVFQQTDKRARPRLSTARRVSHEIVLGLHHLA